MAKIKIKNFGPIKAGYLEDDGWMDIRKVTVFIGNQGSGKSTVAKLISTLTWMEKALTRGDYNINYFTTHNRFKKLLKYHKIDNYFPNQKNNVTNIEYQGDSFSMVYKDGKFNISENVSGNYLLPQIMYVPAERNFISTVRTPKVLKLNSDSLIEFLTEFDNAKKAIRGSLKLPINNVDIEYDKLNDIINIKGIDYKVRLTEASSGYQSAVPLYLVSWFLANLVKIKTDNNNESMSSDEIQRFKNGVKSIWDDLSLSDEQRRIALSVLSSRFNKSAFINIVEEPEQNLFPTSQKDVINSLLEFNNMNDGNKLIITTHSPYIVNNITLNVKRFLIENNKKLLDTNIIILNEINGIAPSKSRINPEGLTIYELGNEGNIIRLGDYHGLPSDENYLNSMLEDFNEDFTKLLEIEEQWL